MTVLHSPPSRAAAPAHGPSSATATAAAATRALAATPAFAEVSAADLETFATSAELATLTAGQVLFRQGDPGDTIYFVITGALDVLVPRPDGSQQRLLQLERGAFTGAMALLAGRNRAATVRAAADAVLLRIRAAALDALATVYPRVKAWMLEMTARRLPMLHLASMDLFRGLDADVLVECSRAGHWMTLPGGAVLFRQGDPGDSLFIVVNGRLEVMVAHDDGARHVVAHLGRGECIGEMALLTGERRAATVRALRDCELIALSGDACRRMLAQRPGAILDLTQVIVGRLRNTTAGRRPSASVATIAVAPASRGGLHAQVANEIVVALGRMGRRVLHINRQRLDAHLGNGIADASAHHLLQHRVLRWLGEQEGRYDHLVFECDEDVSAWSARCLRQADLVLFVASAGAEASPLAHEETLRSVAAGDSAPPRELVLVHADGEAPRDTRRWLAGGRFARHHHVRRHGRADFARVVRLITGRAHALVLGGGGARGFAHLGVLRAFEDARVPIDVIGGTSMGAVIGAQYVMGYGVDAMIELNRRHFVKARPLRDFTVPLVSLITGQRMARVLRGMFGEAAIEDQWLPYFCVATNLSRATLAVHRQGPLAFAVGTSISVPGLAPPMIHEGDFLVDGGLLDNVPVGPMRQVASGTVFAVDVSQAVEFTTTCEPYTQLSGWRVLRDRLTRGGWRRRDGVPGMLRLLSRSTMLNSVHRAGEVQRQSDVYVRPALDGIEMFDWKSIDKAIDGGYRAAADALTTWLAEPRGHGVV